MKESSWANVAVLAEEDPTGMLIPGEDLTRTLTQEEGQTERTKEDVIVETEIQEDKIPRKKRLGPRMADLHREVIVDPILGEEIRREILEILLEILHSGKDQGMMAILNPEEKTISTKEEDKIMIGFTEDHRMSDSKINSEAMALQIVSMMGHRFQIDSLMDP